MPDYRTYRDNAGGKAIVDLLTDVTIDAQALAARTVTAKIALVLRPLKSGAAVGDAITLHESPAALPASGRAWHVTPEQVSRQGFVSTVVAVKGR